MSERTSSYRRVVVDIAAADAAAGFVTGRKILEPGAPVISITVVTLPAAAVDANGLGYINLHIGLGSDPIRLNVQGVSWSAQLDDTGRPTPELTGLFVDLGDAGHLLSVAALGTELYVELLRTTSE